MINRRSFFGNALGTVAGFLGFEKFLKSEEVIQPEPQPLPKYDFKITKYKFIITDYTCKIGPDLYNLLTRPNHSQTFSEFIEACIDQLDLTGTSLTWMVPNKFGIPIELHSIPTVIAVPQPALYPNYPDGYYRIQPLYPYGSLTSFYSTQAICFGAPIPVKWMIRIKSKCILNGSNYYTDKTQNLKQISEALSTQLAPFFGKNIKIEVFENKE